MSAPLGHKSADPNFNPKKSKDERDLQERSAKKKKEGDHSFTTVSSLPKNYTDVVNMQRNEESNCSYKEKMLGMKGGTRSEGGEEDEIAEEEEEGDSMKVEECRVGDYECPKFIFSKLEEKRLYRPWRRGVIVKLLGRRIGYKALETRLKQMWVRKGVISIIDLGNDYYLVAFSHEDDQYAALVDGPWFIYDHYLTVKEWSPNFHPASDTIEEVAVWMRISGLPIEYYDSKILHFIGNRVGKTVKVDKNTLTQERGKYARLCVQVNLTKPLLAMFTIKDRKYNIEYEGLHLLCTICGRFGHYKEGCPDKGRVRSEQMAGGEEGSKQERGGGNIDGPWCVVNKQKRGRRAVPIKNISTAEFNATPAKLNDPINSTGSRFASLSADMVEINEESMDADKEGQEQFLEGDDIIAENHKLPAEKNHKIKNRSMNGGKGGQNVDSIMERPIKDNKLATRGGNNFKGKGGAHVGRGVENLGDMMGAQILESLTGYVNNPIVTIGKKGEFRESKKVDDVGLVGAERLGQKSVSQPNVPRPPNSVETPPFELLSSSMQSNIDLTLEGEVFEDANDQGTNVSSDSEMETIDETPGLTQ
jgi:hypothetical protein